MMKTKVDKYWGITFTMWTTLHRIGVKVGKWQKV